LIDNIIFTANTVAPVFIIVAIGYLSKRIKIINENFVDVTSKFVFSVSLPAFIFLKIIELDLTKALAIDQIIYIYSATILSFILVWVISIPFIKDSKDKSSFIQGAFRGNFAIIGLAIISNLFGKEALGEATIILAFLLPLYNVLAVIVLTVPMRKEKKMNMKSTMIEILFNPLILAVIFALPFSYFNLKLPALAEITGTFLSDIALPLALIGIGGSLNLENIKKASNLAFTSSAIKLIAIPLVFTIGAYLIRLQRAGFRNYVCSVWLSYSNSKFYNGRNNGRKFKTCGKYNPYIHARISVYNCTWYSNTKNSRFDLD
jgi:malonate transporter and related proteins